MLYTNDRNVYSAQRYKKMYLSFDRRVDFFFLDFDLSRDFFLSRDRCLLRLDLLPDRERFRFGDPSGSAGATVGLDSRDSCR